MKNTLSPRTWRDILTSSAVTLALSVVAFLLFIKLGYEVLEKDTAHFDQAIEHFIYAQRTPWLTFIMRNTTFLGSEGAFGGAILVSIFLYLRKRIRAAVFTICVVMGGFAFNYLLKLFFQVPRPIISQLVHEATYSFPSGHAMGSFIFYPLVGYLLALEIKSRWGKVTVFAVAVLIIALVGYSRVYLGVHNPSDIMGSYIVGTCWLLGAYTIIRKITPRQ